jgi:CBS domain-containing protein
MSAGRLCTRVVVTAVPGETVRTAAIRMAGHDVGSLVVVAETEPHQVVGVLTDRDIVVRALAEELDIDRLHIGQIMSSPAQTIDESTPIEQALNRMAEASIRRVVVTGAEGRMVGLLALDDVLGLITSEAWSVGRLLTHQQPVFR